MCGRRLRLGASSRHLQQRKLVDGSLRLQLFLISVPQRPDRIQAFADMAGVGPLKQEVAGIGVFGVNLLEQGRHGKSKGRLRMVVILSDTC